MDPIVFRGIERLLIIVGGIFFGYLGYRLFVNGLTTGEGNLKFESKAMKIIFSGTGPGLFFMAFGAIVLVVAIVIGGVSIKETTTSPITSTVQPDPADRAATTKPADSGVTSERETIYRMELPRNAATPKLTDSGVKSERGIPGTYHLNQQQ